MIARGQSAVRNVGALPFRFLRSSALVESARFCAAVLGYGGLLFLFRLVTVDEPRSVKRALWRRPSGASGANAGAARNPACASP